MARDPRPWRQAALGGGLVTLGAVLFGATRKPDEAAAAAPRQRRDAADVDTVPAEGAPPPLRTRHWPPRDAAPSDPKASEDNESSEPLPVDAESKALGYETEDTRVAALATVMIVSVAVIAISVAGLFVVIGRIHRIDARSPPLTPQQSAVLVPPGPHLQGDPLGDIALEIKREQDLLDHYAWVDPGHSRARIPIGRALQLVTGRPLDPREGRP